MGLLGGRRVDVGAGLWVGCNRGVLLYLGYLNPAWVLHIAVSGLRGQLCMPRYLHGRPLHYIRGAESNMAMWDSSG